MPAFSGNVALFATNKASWARFYWFSCFLCLCLVNDGANERPYYLIPLGHNLEVHTIYYVCHLHQPSLLFAKFVRQVHRLLQRFVGSLLEPHGQ